MFEYIEFIISYGEGLSPEKLQEKTRKGEIVYARQLVMYFCKQFKVGFYTVIAGKYSQTHAMVNYAIKTINNYIEFDKVKRARIRYYRKIINKIAKLSERGHNITNIIAPLEKQISELESRCINLSIQLTFMKSQLGSINLKTES